MKLEMSRRRIVVWLGLLSCLVLAVGCDAKSTQGTTETTDIPPVEAQVPATEEGVPDASAAAYDESRTEEREDPLGPAKNPATSKDAAKPEGEPAATAARTDRGIEGWWRILFSTPSEEDGLVHDVSAGFLKIGKNDDGFAVTETRFNGVINPAELTRKTAITEQDVRLFFQYEDLRFDYAGALDEDGVIRGNLQFEGTRQNIVRLEPVTEESVPEEVSDPEDIGPTVHAEEIRDAVESDDPGASLQAGTAEWAGSPSLYFAYREILGQTGEAQLDDAAIQGLVEQFLKEAAVWGERAVAHGKIIAGATLISNGKLFSFGQDLIDQARKEAPELAGYWEAEIALVEEIASIERAWEKVESGDEEGLKTLQTLYDAGMPSRQLTYRLAQAERKLGSPERAERLFAEVVILPWSMDLTMLENTEGFVPAEEIVATMYEERTGSSKGLESYLQTVYHEQVAGFVPDEEKNRAATESKRVVLLELFTGATCPPCVAADVGTEAIEKSFPQEDAVVLRYHLHIPGPDPLATEATAERQEYYSAEILGTPTLLVNGTKPIFPIGGPYERSEMAYQGISGMLSEKVTEPTTATLELAASVEGEDLHITANGSAGEKPFDTVKLRIVIAENEIDFPASNGVKHHSMIVRGMPGGAEGIASEEGKYSFDETVSLVELRGEINRYLDSFESMVGHPFSSRPGNFRHLTVVAFLQDDVTREVLQAAVVPIEEEIVLPSATAEEEVTEEASDPEEKAPKTEAGGPELSAPEEN